MLGLSRRWKRHSPLGDMAFRPSHMFRPPAAAHAASSSASDGRTTFAAHHGTSGAVWVESCITNSVRQCRKATSMHSDCVTPAHR